MSKIELDLSQTSDKPGWVRDDYSEHDAYWRESATRYTYTTAVDPDPVHSDSGSFDSASGDTQINLIEFPHTQVGNNPDTGAPAISIDWQEDESVDIALNRAWNTIKNIEISDFTGSALRISNFVDAWVHLDGDADRNVTIDGVKRAEVVTGGGDDDVRIGIDSNTADWSNDLRIDTGAGDDWINVGPASRDFTGDGEVRTGWTNGQVFAGSGDDVVSVGWDGNFTIDGGDGSDDLYGGNGDDIIMGGNDTLNGNGGEPYHNYLSGGSGDDTLIGAKWGTNEFRLIDVGPGDHIIGGNLTDRLYVDYQFAAYDVTAAGNSALVNGATVQAVENVGLDFLEEAKVTITGDFSAGDLDTISVTIGYSGNAPHESSFDVDARGASGVDVELRSYDGPGTFLGGSGDDQINLYLLDSRDVLDGGGGADELRFETTVLDAGSNDVNVEGKGSWIDIDGAKISGIESIIIGSGSSDHITVSGALADTGLRSVTYTSNTYSGDEGDTFDASGSTDAAVRFTLTGGAGDDVLTGGAGDDIVTGGAGDDIVSGGTAGTGDGADHFVFAPDSGNDEIVDFNAGSGDIIDIAGYGFSSFEQLQEEGRITVMDGQTHITLGDNDSIEVHETGLTADDFMFG